MDHSRERFFISVSFSATRKDSAHGTLWRLCTRTVRRVESCSKNNSLACDAHTGRLVAPLEPCLDHLLARWQGLMCFLSDAWLSSLRTCCRIPAFVSEDVRERERERERTEGAEWPRGLSCIVAGLQSTSLPFPQNPCAFSPSAFSCFFFHRPYAWFLPLRRWTDDENYAHRHCVVQTA